MRALLVALLVLSALLGGCSGASVDVTKAPQWKAGERWEFRDTVQGTTTSQGATRTTSQTSMANATVVAVHLPSAFGDVAVRFLQSGQSPTYASLEAVTMENHTSLSIAPRLGVCGKGDLCMPPVAASIDGPSPSNELLRFPLTPGKNWTLAAGFLSPSATIRVIGPEEIDVPAGHLSTMRLRLEVHAGSTPSDFNETGDFWYAPEAGDIVRMALVVDGTNQNNGAKEVAHATYERVLVRHVVGAVPSMQDLAPSLHLGPNSFSAAYGPQISILQHPFQFKVGDKWTFSAGTRYTYPDPLPPVRWTLARMVPGLPEQVVDTANGTTTFPVQFNEPGSYHLTVQAMKDGKDVLGNVDQDYFLVDQHLEASGACHAAVGVLGTDSGGCDGASFTLPPGTYSIEAKASYSAEQAAAPCASLVLLKDGQENGRSYAGSPGAGLGASINLRAPLLTQAPASMQVRWAPSVGSPQPVHYTIDIHALSDGSFAGVPPSGTCSP